jgi:hypothetical protein
VYTTVTRAASDGRVGAMYGHVYTLVVLQRGTRVIHGHPKLETTVTHNLKSEITWASSVQHTVGHN